MLNVLWFPNFACNIRCTYCWNRGYFHINHSSNILKIAHNLSSYNIDTCTIAGGEPLIINEIFDVIDIIKEKVKKIRVFTNATLKNSLEQLVQKKPSEIVVSLDSNRVDINDLNRESGIKVINNLIWLSKNLLNDTKLTIYICVYPENLNSLGDFLKWIEALGIRNIQLSFIYNNNKFDNSRFQFLTEYETNKAIEVLINLLKSSVFNNKQELVNYLNFLKELENQNYSPGKHCGSTYSIVNIDPQGLIKICPHRKETIGNLLLESFDDSINRWYKSVPLKELGECISVNCLHMFKDLS